MFEQVNYVWCLCYDGLLLSEDCFVQNGIIVEDDGLFSVVSDVEKIQFINFMEEQMEVLCLGFQEQFFYVLYLDGMQVVDVIIGLDVLVLFVFMIGVVGGIDCSVMVNVYWCNNVSMGFMMMIGIGIILNQMEVQFCQCLCNGGWLDLMIVGFNYVDGYWNFVLNMFGCMDFGFSNIKKVEGGMFGLIFQGVDIQWLLEFQELDVCYVLVMLWEKCLYMFNSMYIMLCLLQGYDMKMCKLFCVYDCYEYYWGLIWCGGLMMSCSSVYVVLVLV